MRCMICNTEHEENICPVCGFDESMNYAAYATLSPVPEETVAHVLAAKEEWSKISSLNIYIYGHYYELVGEDQLQYVKSEECFITGGKELKEGEISWGSLLIPRIEGQDILTVCLVVKSSQDPKLDRKFHVMIDNPGGQGDECWKVGILFRNKENMIARLALGTEKLYQTSDDFRMTF